MNSMNRRISGEQTVPTSVRFADVKPYKNKVFINYYDFK